MMPVLPVKNLDEPHYINLDLATDRLQLVLEPQVLL